MAPLSWCLASSHLPVLVVSNGERCCFVLLSAAARARSKTLKRAFCGSTLRRVHRSYHLRWPFTFINKREGYPPPNYILSHEGDTWQLSVIHVTPLLTCRKKKKKKNRPDFQLIKTPRDVERGLVVRLFFFVFWSTQPAATSECARRAERSSFSGLVTYS